MRVFLELDVEMFERLYLEEVFIDRGVRKLVPLGAPAEAYIAAQLRGKRKESGVVRGKRIRLLARLCPHGAGRE